MGNKRSDDSQYEYATVDTAPGADGYFTSIIDSAKISVGWKRLYFSTRGSGVMIITLQFKCIGDDDWSDYDSYTSTDSCKRKIIEGGVGGIQWRAGVKQEDYTSGSMRFGFDWRG